MLDTMKRRDFALLLPGLAMAAASQAQIEAPAQASAKKDGEVPRPFRKVSVPEDGRRVLFFFDYACPFCARYHGPLKGWAATVPKPVQTMFVPVVNLADLARRREQVIAARCFYAAMAVGTRAQVAAMSNVIYEDFQSVRDLTDKGMWKKAIAAAGISAERFASALSSKTLDTQVEYAARKTAQYELRATPSVAVGGRYVMTPDDVLGDERMFFNILNGLTSEIL